MYTLNMLTIACRESLGTRLQKVSFCCGEKIAFEWKFFREIHKSDIYCQLHNHLDSILWVFCLHPASSLLHNPLSHSLPLLVNCCLIGQVSPGYVVLCSSDLNMLTARAPPIPTSSSVSTTMLAYFLLWKIWDLRWNFELQYSQLIFWGENFRIFHESGPICKNFCACGK